MKKDILKEGQDYLNSATPEQLEEDRKEIEKWNKIGPTVSEYFKFLDNDEG